MATEVLVGDELTRFVEGLIRDSNPAIVEELERAVEELKAEAVKSWPVGAERGRAHSRDMFRTELVVTPDAIEARIVNTAPYLYKIRTEQNDLGGKSPFSRLIRTPARRKAKAIAEAIGDKLVALGAK